jgi:hypothetical protein
MCSFEIAAIVYSAVLVLAVLAVIPRGNLLLPFYPAFQKNTQQISFLNSQAPFRPSIRLLLS